MKKTGTLKPVARPKRDLSALKAMLVRHDPARVVIIYINYTLVGGANARCAILL
jgi:hypothetical protein